MTQEMKQIFVILEKGKQEDIFCIQNNLKTATRMLQCVHTALMENMARQGI